MSMDGAPTNISGPGRGGRPIKIAGGLVNDASGDACGGQLGDVSHSIEIPSGSE